MRCEMISMTPGPHGEGVEIPCNLQAVLRINDVPCCRKHAGISAEYADDNEVAPLMRWQRPPRLVDGKWDREWPQEYVGSWMWKNHRLYSTFKSAPMDESYDWILPLSPPPKETT